MSNVRSLMPARPRLRLTIAVALALAAITCAAFPGGKLIFVFLIVPFAVAFAILGLLSVVVAVLSARGRAWKRAAVEAAFASIVGVTFLQPAIAFVPLRTAAAYVELATSYSKFRSELATQPQTSQPRLLIHETDGFLSFASGLAYDESGEISRPPGTQSPSWRIQAGDYPLASKCWSSTHLLGNYYWWWGDYACV